MLTKEQKKVVNDMLDTIKFLEQQNKHFKDALKVCAELGECQLDYAGSIETLEQITLIASDALRQTEVKTCSKCNFEITDLDWAGNVCDDCYREEQINRISWPHKKKRGISHESKINDQRNTIRKANVQGNSTCLSRGYEVHNNRSVLPGGETMRESILRVIDDLQTRKANAEELEIMTRRSKRPREVMENMMSAGAVEGLKYAIQELRKVLDENGQS
jgi:hypothetical protein